MKTNRISSTSRILLIICGLALLIVLVQPIWKIDLVAPQYPEGLSLFIHADTLAGNVDIINGLNHYIGMKVLKVEDFPEFKILPYCIIFFSIIFVLTGIVGKKKGLIALVIAFVLFGVIAMYDFWRWEYNYGHDLDPNAAIQVPGMSYQPPLIGYKQLLNFEAYSYPATGGWIFFGAGLIAVLCLFFELRKKRTLSFPATAMIMLLMIGSCNTGPSPIKYGVDDCHFCKMKISDSRFGAELLTKKGRTYKFDDSVCLIEFVKENTVKAENIGTLYLASFYAPQELLVVDSAILIKNEKILGPMSGNVVALRNKAELDKLNQELNDESEVVKWEELLK